MLGSTPELFSQLNFSVGFTSGRASSDEIRSIFKEYNEAQNFEEELGSLVWLNGVNLGFRRKYENMAVYIGWTNLRRTKSGFKEMDNGLFEKDLKFTMNTYELGLENYIGFFAYGFSLGQRTLNIKTPIAASDKDRVVSSDSQWISRFHFSLNSGGGSFSSIALKPFIEFAWQDNDLNDLNDELLPPKVINISDRIHLVGVSIIFYNGSQ